MSIGTSIEIINTGNFDFLQNLKNDQQLKIKVELGFLDIPRRCYFPSSYVEQNVVNPYFPVQGGAQAESFVQNATLRNNKSTQLKPTVNGVIPPVIDISGAPYCTFLVGTLLPDQTHPYYNLIKGPNDAPTQESTSTLTYIESSPVIVDQQFQANDDPNTVLFNKLGSVFIPSTNKTSNAVANLNLSALPSYNLWKVENISDNYYNFQRYLGWLPKNNAPVNQLQPYAQTWSFSDTAQIQVYASNSQVKMSRIYPIAKDYAHVAGSKYLIYNSATQENPSLETVDIGLDKIGQPAVGFFIKFSSLVVTNTNAAETTNGTTLTEARLIVCWGDTEANQEQLNQYTSRGLIGKYTLEISPNTSPRLFFNIAGDLSQLNSSQKEINQFSVELNSLKSIDSSDKNSGAKTPNDYTLYVYYTGEYLKIGTSRQISEWQIVRDQMLKIKNTDSAPGQQVNLKHHLDEKSQINIQAQYMNFIYSYGPPLFSPHDDQNIPSAQGNYNLTNTLCAITGNIPNYNDNLDAELIQSDILDYIKQNSALTFQQITGDNQREFGGASAYIDARANTNRFLATVSKDSNFLKYKITIPKHLGGTVFNKFMPIAGEYPEISENYVNYDLKTEEGENISDILTQSVSELSISKQVDEGSGAFINSELNINFLNLNRSAVGLKILQFIRQNVCVLRISAGYDYLYPYFEGMVENVSVDESLEKTKIVITAHDLLKQLFIDPDTLIYSLIRFQFPGMRFNKIIEYVHKYTELYHHLAYDLGDNIPGTIYYRLYSPDCTDVGLPKIIDTMAVANLAKINIAPYSTSLTYFNCLSQIRDLLLQPVLDNLNSSPCYPNRFDVPIFYWYHDGKTDGVIMSSRTLPKDRDLFFLRKDKITDLMTKDIKELHGYVRGAENAFESASNANNLQARALYRGLSIDGSYFRVDYLNNIALEKSENIENFNGYVGYDKIAIFDKPEDFPGTQTSIDGVVLPDEKYALRFITSWFNASYKTVYEQINLKVFVTKPLKSHGYFNVCIESEDNPLPDQYLYSKVVYNFDLNANLINADISASRKPIQGL